MHFNRYLLRGVWKYTLSYITHHKVISGTSAGVLIVLALVIATASATMTPNNLFYPLKRAGESVLTALAPTRALRQQLQFDFANRRVTEASELVQAGLNSSTAGNLGFSGSNVAHAAGGTNANPKLTETINQLLNSFEQSYVVQNNTLNQQLANKDKRAIDGAKARQKAAANVYATLALLRVQAPTQAQVPILASIDATQNYLVSTADALNQPPVSSSNLSQLSKLIPAGLLSKSDVDGLANNKMTNRQFHAKLVNFVTTGQLPSDMMYRLDQDLIKQLAPDSASRFEAVAEFEQMQRISATIQASQPTEDQQKDIQTYLAQYNAGQAVPDNDIKPFVEPIIYAMTLSGELQTSLSSLKTVGLSNDNQALLDSWEGSLASNQDNLGQLYQQLMTKASHQPELYLASLTKVQEELLAAEKEEVAHLVLPPGWDVKQLADLTRLMGVQIAETQFLTTKTTPEVQLASVSVTQQQLQTNIETMSNNQATLITNLETKINNFGGTPEQRAQLQETLTLLKETQGNATTVLQTQIKDIGETHTNLQNSLETLTKEQLIALTELELRAATNAQTLTDANKTTITNQLNQIDQTSQTLIDNLQSRVDSLDASDISLREELTANIALINSSYSTLESYVQAELTTGRAATDQLQTQLQTAQTSLTTHTTELAGLATSADNLTQLIVNVSNDANTQVDQLQSQLNALTTDQQSLHSAIDTLQNDQTAAMANVTDQLANLNALQAEASAAINNLNQTQTTTQNTLNSLANNFTDLENALATTEQSYTTIATTITNQAGELASFQTETQSLLDGLTANQTTLSNQVNGLVNNVANLSQTVTALQSSTTTTQAQLDELIANPPWSIIPEETLVTQEQLASLQTSLDSQFVAKSAALDAQFQTFQQQLNAEVDQLESTITGLGTTVTNQGTQITQDATDQAELEQTVTTLQNQVNTLQTQVQALGGTGL